MASEREKGRGEFRDYTLPEGHGVRELYRLNHANQTLALVRAKKAEFLPPRRRRMGVWEAIEFLGQVVDQSDPDIELSQIAYDFLMNDRDRAHMDVVRRFNPYDLYSKSNAALDFSELRPYYEELVAEFLPPVLQW